MAKGEDPAKRSKRYARELKSGKNELTGKPLTKGQRAFRGGVLNERKWGAGIFKHKEKLHSNRIAKQIADLDKKTNKSISAFGQDNIPNPDDIHGAYGGSWFPINPD